VATHFLYLTNAGVVSFIARGGRLEERHAFPIISDGIAAFEQYVTTVKDLPARIITDLVEEDFRLDTVPHVSGKDRDAVFARKLNQIFRSTPYRTAILQGREADGRRDDRVIYTAVTNPEVLRPWVEALEKNAVPLEGIHSSAVLSARLLVELDLEFPHALLLTFTPGDAIRQTYFRRGEIKFSRLTPLDLEEGQTLGSLLAGETTRTWQYLDSLRNFGADDRLEVCVLLHPKDRPAVQASLRDFSPIQYRILDIEQVAAKLGLKPPPIASSAEAVLVHLFTRKPQPNHFATPELRRFASLRNARIALNAMAAVVLAAGLAWSGWNGWLALQKRDDDSAVNQSIVALNREYDLIRRSMPTQGVGSDAMRDAVAFYNGTLKNYPSVAQFLVPVSRVLEVHPRIRLMQIAWQASDDEKAMPKLAPSTPRNAPPVKAVAGSGSTPPPAPTPAGQVSDAPFPSGRAQVALFEAVIQVRGSDFRPAIIEIERLIRDLGKMPGYSADLVDPPLDITTGVGIQGRLESNPDVTSEVRFTFRVTRATEGAA
jgi:hypothetical protein